MMIGNSIMTFGVHCRAMEPVTTYLAITCGQCISHVRMEEQAYERTI
jgi:hypothetical protein